MDDIARESTDSDKNSDSTLSEVFLSVSELLLTAVHQVNLRHQLLYLLLKR